MSSNEQIGKQKGALVQQRAWLRANLVNRFFRAGNALQVQTQALLALNSEISVVHFRILLRLTQAGPQNVQGIAALLGTDPSNISRALPVLLGKGWVEQQPSPSDRRQSIISLTAKGEKAVKDNRDAIDARLIALRSAFEDEEFEQLLDYLDRIDAVLSIPAQEFAKQGGDVIQMKGTG